MKNILHFLLVIYSPLNSIIITLYQIYLKLYNFIISIHFGKKINFALTSTVNRLNIFYKYFLYLNKYRYNIDFFYFDNNNFYC